MRQQVLNLEIQHQSIEDRTEDLESVYEIINKSKADQIQSNQTEQSDQLAQQKIWLIALTIMGGAHLLFFLGIFCRQPISARIGERNGYQGYQPDSPPVVTAHKVENQTPI